MQLSCATNHLVPHRAVPYTRKYPASGCSAVWRKNNWVPQCHLLAKHVCSHIDMLRLYFQIEAGRNSYLSMKVPKSSLMVFCMFSVHSQLHWSFISRHKMFKATSATAVSAAINTKKYSTHITLMTYCTDKAHQWWKANVYTNSGVLLHPSGKAALQHFDPMQHFRTDITDETNKWQDCGVNLNLSRESSCPCQAAHSSAWLSLSHSAHIKVVPALWQSSPGRTVTCHWGPKEHRWAKQTCQLCPVYTHLSEMVNTGMVTYSAAFTKAVCHFRM